MQKLKVLAFSRKPLAGQYSVERINSNLDFIKSDLFSLNLLRSKFHSKGVINRLKICLELFRYKSYNLVHVTGDITFSIIALSKPKKIITILDLRFTRYRGFKKYLLKYFWFTLPIQIADKVITISDEVKSEILNHFNIPRDKIVVVPVPINNQFFQDFKVLENTSQKIKFLIVGTKANKNIENMLKALNVDYPFEVLIIGRLTREHLQLLKNKEYRNIEVATDLEILEAYQWADCLLFASKFEGFGMPIIEAQATKTLVITSDLEPMKTVSAGHAILVNPDDVDSIRSGLGKLKDIVGDSDFLNNARYNALRYSSTEYCRRLSEIYEEILSAKR